MRVRLQWPGRANSVDEIYRFGPWEIRRLAVILAESQPWKALFGTGQGRAEKSGRPSMSEQNIPIVVALLRVRCPPLAADWWVREVAMIGVFRGSLPFTVAPASDGEETAPFLPWRRSTA